MPYYVMVGETEYPAADIEDVHTDGFENDSWIDADVIEFKVPEPVVYDLDPDYPGNVPVLFDDGSIPFMRDDLVDALKHAGVDNIQYYQALIRDPETGQEYTNFKSFNIIGKVSAADMTASKIIGEPDSDMIDVDFDRLVIDEEKCKGLLLFRLAENVSAIIVNQSVKNEIEKRKIEGLFFYANGEWSG